MVAISNRPLPPSAPGLYPPLQGPACQASLQMLGQMAFRTGGPDPTIASDFFFHDWPELGERIDTCRCSRCGRLEMYDHDFSLPER